jgi:hypothetical protein
MSNQPENEQTEIMTPEEVRQYVLAEIDATKQVIAELSEEELEEVAGGAFVLPSFSSLPSFSRVVDHFSTYGPHYMNAAQTATGLYQTYKARRPSPPAPGR